MYRVTAKDSNGLLHMQPITATDDMTFLEQPSNNGQMPILIQLSARIKCKLHRYDFTLITTDNCFHCMANLQHYGSQHNHTYTRHYPHVWSRVDGPQSTYICSRSPSHIARSLLPRYGFEASLSSRVMTSAPVSLRSSADRSRLGHPTLSQPK